MLTELDHQGIGSEKKSEIQDERDILSVHNLYTGWMVIIISLKYTINQLIISFFLNVTLNRIMVKEEKPKISFRIYSLKLVKRDLLEFLVQLARAR